MAVVRNFQLTFRLTEIGGRNMKFCMKINYNHSYELGMKCCKLTITDMETLRKFQFMSDKFRRNRICN